GIDYYDIDILSQTIDIVASKTRYTFIDGQTRETGNVFELSEFGSPNICFPNAPLRSQLPITHSLVNRRVYQKIGGYTHERVSGDYEFKDRALAFGFNFRFVDKVLMNMFANHDSLTVAPKTAVGSEFRKQIEEKMRARLRELRYIRDRESHKELFQNVVDLENLKVEFISNPKMLTLNTDIPSTLKTRDLLELILKS
ncbi:MAG: hypothetical protein KBC84_10290, partial [Proteobacteria bacterium]|nr:hypothetical protein [Pseudomonadota bacterium]